MIVPRYVPSTDGVDVALHDLGGAGPTLLISHATGFHGRCYLPLAGELADRFHSVAFDYRGHGDTLQPAELAPDWHRYGQDALAVAEALDPPLVAFGHSMGGACLLMAAHRNPMLFSQLVLFEPIVFPTNFRDGSTEPSPLVEGARRRRSTFPSFAAAIANYSAKRPLNAFTPASLEAYVNHGFAKGSDGQVHLKCRPAIEAATFELGGTHDTFDLLADIEVPVLVISGKVEINQPSAIAELVADALPNGRYLRLDELDHFGPMTDPHGLADVIAQSIARTL